MRQAGIGGAGASLRLGGARSQRVFCAGRPIARNEERDVSHIMFPGLLVRASHTGPIRLPEEEIK
jgi:hypothetical protein